MYLAILITTGVILFSTLIFCCLFLRRKENVVKNIEMVDLSNIKKKRQRKKSQRKKNQRKKSLKKKKKKKSPKKKNTT